MSVETYFTIWLVIAVAGVATPWLVGVVATQRGASNRLRAAYGVRSTHGIGDATGLAVGALALGLLAALRQFIPVDATGLAAAVGGSSGTIALTLSIVSGLGGSLLASNAERRGEVLLAGFATSVALALFVGTLLALLASFGPLAMALALLAAALLVIPSRNLAISVWTDTLREPWLRTQHAASRERCLTSWERLGVSADVAEALLDDPPISPQELSLDDRLVLVVGEFGSGKSLIVERRVQHMAAEAAGDFALALPIILQAAQSVGRLDELVGAALESIGVPEAAPIVVFVDGLDEIEMRQAIELVSDGRQLIARRSASQVVMTSRLLPIDIPRLDVRPVAALQPDEARALISVVAGRELNAWTIDSWQVDLREAVTLPLFAVLAGVYFRANPGLSPSSSDLISFLVARSTETFALTGQTLLLRLAMQSLDAAGPVPRSEAGTQSEIQALFASRLVIDRGSGLELSPAILKPWLGAQALGDALVDAVTLFADDARTTRWRSALEVATGALTYARLAPVLDALIEAHPTLASSLLAERVFRIDRTEALPPAAESGIRIRDAMAVWLRGLAEFQRLGPVTPAGELGQLGISVTGPDLITAWRTDIHSPEIVPFTPTRDWNRVTSGRPDPRPAWPWMWTLSDLQRTLEVIVDPRRMRVETAHLTNEALWRAALEISGKGAHGRASRLPIAPILAGLNGYPANEVLTLRNWNYQVGWLIERFTEMQARQEFVENPVPGRDLPPVRGRQSAWVWEGFSTPSLTRRTQVVYAEALKGFKEFTSAFPNVSRDLPLADALPVRVVGHLREGHGTGIESQPTLVWTLMPLPANASSEAVIDAAPSPSSESMLDEQFEAFRRLRPEGPAWRLSGVHYEGLDIFGPAPATDVMFRWIVDALADTHLIARRGWISS
jgi:hypothetical protein